MLIMGCFYGDGVQFLFMRDDVKTADFNIKVVADIRCDIDGSVATTLRSSTIENPIYGYNPETEAEIDFKANNEIAVMAVDDLSCELPKDASVGFWEIFLKNVIPVFFNDDADGVLERSRMTQNGKLIPRLSSVFCRW